MQRRQFLATGTALAAVGIAPLARGATSAPANPADAALNALFDRLLLAQCRVEGMRLVTRDRVLGAHPLAWPAG